MNKFRLGIVVIALTLILGGCVTSLSAGGAGVRLVDNSSNQNCEALGLVTGSASWGWGTAHNMDGAINEVRNEVAELGGNAYELVSASADVLTSTAIGKAMKCPSE